MNSEEQENTVATGKGIPSPEPSGGEDFNSTMMSIDISGLNLDATRTGIASHTENTANEEMAVTPRPTRVAQDSWLKRAIAVLKTYWQRDKSPRKDESSGKAKKTGWSPQLLPWQGTWLCARSAPLLWQLSFYVLRLGILGVAFFVQFVFVNETVRAFSIQHPAALIFASVFTVQLLLLILSLSLRASAAWFLTLPTGALALVMSWGALFYHTADPLYFTILGQPVSAVLNSFYGIVFLFTFVISVFWMAEHRVMKLIFGGLTLICVMPVAIQFQQDKILEFGFFGFGILQAIPYSFLQPLTVVFHGIMPLLTILFLVQSVWSAPSTVQQISRGMARALTILFLCLLVLNFSLMQKNRVTHIFNELGLVTRQLGVGAVEQNFLNQNLKIATRDFEKSQGLDTAARYRFKLEKSKDKDKYLFRAADAFGFPVPFLTQKDVVVLSDGKPVKDFSFQEEKDSKSEGARYVLSVKLEPKQALIEWPTMRQSLDPKGKFIFKLNDLDKIKRVVIKRGADTLLEVKDPTQAALELPLFYLGVGPQKVTIFAEDGLGQNILTEDVDLSLKLQNDFTIISPQPNDVVTDQLGVVLALEGIQPSAVSKVSYDVAGKTIATSSGFDLFHSLDLTTIPAGDVHVRIRMQLADKEKFREVTVKKVPNPPVLEITKPAMGIFADSDLPVTYNLSTPEKITEVSVWVNGVLFENLKAPETAINLPVSRWQSQVLYVAVQVTTESMKKYSDWMQINRGSSQLALKFDLNTLGFLNVNQAAILLDASVSQVDSWQGKSKWSAMTYLFAHPEIQARLEYLKPTLAVLGSEKPYYFHDCEDAVSLVKEGEFKKSQVKQKLEALSPKGVSALVAGLKKAFSTKPERVYVFADSADSCDADILKSLKKVLADSPKTMVSIFTLGKIQESDAKQLQALAQQTGGHYFQPEDSDALVATWLKELSLNYQLVTKDRLVDESALLDKTMEVSPGDYILKIPYGNEMKEIPFHLENGSKTTLAISGKNQDGTQIIAVDQSDEKIQ